MDYYGLINSKRKVVVLLSRDPSTTEERVWRDGAWKDDGGLLAEAIVDGWPNLVKLTEANALSLRAAM